MFRQNIIDGSQLHESVCCVFNLGLPLELRELIPFSHRRSISTKINRISSRKIESYFRLGRAGRALVCMNPRQLSSGGWISASVDALDGALNPMVGMEIIEIETLRRDGVPGPDGFC